jgi:hypothetical protein
MIGCRSSIERRRYFLARGYSYLFTLSSDVEKQVCSVTLQYLCLTVTYTRIAYMRIVTMEPLLADFKVGHVMPALKISVVIYGPEKIEENLRSKRLRNTVIGRLNP